MDQAENAVPPPHPTPATAPPLPTPLAQFWAVPPWLQGIASHLYTHNPFYLVSSGLVLFGLQTSFAGNHELANGWLLMELLCGYAVLLAVVGWAIVRWGSVWEDARMILLVILLLFVALSNSFDSFALNDYHSGGRMLGVGFLFAVGLSEVLFRALPLRLAWRYRIPLYLQLALLFGYPVWLAYLSIEDLQPEMAWYVFLFPAFSAISLLALLPAAHLAGKSEPPSGTPWRWPWYPWPVFVFLGVGLLLRSYSLSISFEIAIGMQSAFEPYFLLAPLLAVVLLVVEACLATEHRTLANRLLYLPLLLLPLALPGMVENEAQLFLSMLLNASIGEPGRLYAGLLVLFYAYAWLRRLPAGEFCTLLSLGLLSVLGPGTRDVGAMQYPIWQPLALAGGLEFLLGLWKRDSLRMVGCAFCSLAGATYLARHTQFLQEGHGAYPLFLGLVVLLLVGIFGEDSFARAIRRKLPLLLIGGSLVTASLSLLQVPLVSRLLMLSTLVLLSFVAWRREPIVAQLLALLGSIASSSFLLMEPAHRLMQESVLAKGLHWLLGGLFALAAGMLISFQKGGLLNRLRQWLKDLNQAWAGE